MWPFTYFTLCFASLEKQEVLQVAVFKKSFRSLLLLSHRSYPLSQKEKVKQFYISQLSPFVFVRQLQALSTFDGLSWESLNQKKPDQKTLKTWVKAKVFPYLHKDLKLLFYKTDKKKICGTTVDKHSFPVLAAFNTLFLKQDMGQFPLLYLGLESCFFIQAQQVHPLKESFSQHRQYSPCFISRLKLLLSQVPPSRPLYVTGEILCFPHHIKQLAKRLNIPLKPLLPLSFSRPKALLCLGAALSPLLPPELPLSFALPYAGSQLLSQWKKTFFFYSKYLIIFLLLLNAALFTGNQYLQKQLSSHGITVFSFQKLRQLKQSFSESHQALKPALLSNQPAGELIHTLLPIFRQNSGFILQKLQIEASHSPSLLRQKKLHVFMEASAAPQEARKVILHLQKTLPQSFHLKNKIYWKNENHQNTFSFSVVKVANSL